MKNYTKVPAPKGLPAWPAAMLGLSAERPRGVSRAGGRVSLACAAVGAIDRESERGEESARLLTQSWTRTGVDARRTRDIDLLVSRGELSLLSGAKILSCLVLSCWAADSTRNGGAGTCPPG